MPTTARALVDVFYERIWNDGNTDAAREIVTKEFTFRGSLGAELQGIDAFTGYVRSVREALAEYKCEILEFLAEGNRAFAKMRFSGRHVGVFRGHAGTGKGVHWLAAALFTFDENLISEIWVLGDLDSLDRLLRSQADSNRPSTQA